MKYHGSCSESDVITLIVYFVIVLIILVGVALCWCWVRARVMRVHPGVEVQDIYSVSDSGVDTDKGPGTLVAW